MEFTTVVCYLSIPRFRCCTSVFSHFYYNCRVVQLFLCSQADLFTLASFLQQIEIQFNHLDLEWCPACSCDAVEIYVNNSEVSENGILTILKGYIVSKRL